MANCRYYAVAGGDIWAMRYASRLNWLSGINRSRMIAFVNGAVQELGKRGESTPPYACSIAPATYGRVSRGSAPLFQPTVEAETPRGPYKQNDKSAHD